MIHNRVLQAAAAARHRAGGYPPQVAPSTHSVSALSQPGWKSTVTSPGFGTKITRVSDKTGFGYATADASTWLRNIYSKRQAWNSDQSLCLIGYLSPMVLLNASDYSVLNNNFTLASAGRDDQIWSMVDPTKLRTVSTNSIVEYTINTTTGVVTGPTTLKTFSTLGSLTPAKISIGIGEGNPSDDDKYWPIVPDADANNQGRYFAIWDKVNNTVSNVIDVGSNIIDNVGVSHDGNWVYVNYHVDGSSRFMGIEAFSISHATTPVVAFARQLRTTGEHGDCAVDTAGNQVWVSVEPNTSKPQVIMYRFDTGAATILYQEPIVNSGNTWGSHISGRNYNRPGYVYLSDSYATTTGFYNYQAVIAIKLDPSTSQTLYNAPVEYYAHTRQSPKANFTGTNGSYPWEAMATVSPDGKKVLFGSDWLLGQTAPAYAYVANM